MEKQGDVRQQFKIGEWVGFTRESMNADRDLTISAIEQHNGLDFYRVAEIPAGLFLKSSLYSKSRASEMRGEP